MPTKILNVLKDPLKVFLIFSITFGGIFVFLTPPLQVPDEGSHFFRSYQVAEFNIVSDSFKENGIQRYGGKIPKSIADDVHTLEGNIIGKPDNKFPVSMYGQVAGHKLDADKEKNIGFEGASLYPPVSYLPQSFGIFLGKTAGFSPLVLLWMGRLCNLAAWIACVYVALRMLPVAKWGAVALALNPLMLFLAASLSSDVLAIGLLFILVSLVLNARTKSFVLTRRYLYIFTALLCLIALTKPTNVLFCLLIFLLPMQLFTDRKKYLYYCLGSFGAALALSLMWVIVTRQAVAAVGAIQQPGVVFPKSQVKFIVTNPIEYIQILFNNYVTIGKGGGDSVIRSYAGTFGWLDTNIPLWTLILQSIVFVVALTYQVGRGIVLGVREKVFVLGMVFATCLSIVTAIYVNYNAPHAPIIDGVQGRYFIPMSILLVLLFTGRKKILNVTEKSMSLFMCCSIFVILIISTLTILSRYYLGGQ